MKNKPFKKLSVIVPIFNEEKVLPELVKQLTQFLSKTKIEHELIFIDDHSTDKTDQFFKRIKAKNIVFQKKNGKKGKAYSLVQGFEAATGDVLCMIDGDLQYPPAAIPQMVKALKEADVVVANRRDYQDSLLRRVESRVFRFAFGRLLFGLRHDIQAGLKMFRKEVFETVKFRPSSPWTFDLEFLHRAKQAGFSIQNFDIVFARRGSGGSKVGFMKTTLEIGFNALRLRAKRIHPVHIASNERGTMLGAGVRYKERKYVTHTTMPHKASALRTVTLSQKLLLFFLIICIALGIYLFPLRTFQVVIAILSFIYFVDVLFNLYLMIKSLTFPREISFSEDEINNLEEKNLPLYTVLCPLYREARVIPQFLEAMANLAWPKEKLDVILLLEEDDQPTLEAVKEMSLPSYVRALVVPHSIPKTKPKACNYGLAHAKGEYLTIYDAEDIPDPLQLKKAYLGFKKVDKDTICLQAKLNYYNPHQNLLTRFFTAEYSLWFDVTLTGLQSIDTVIPLGGTSNHFKIAYLREVEGWDPFNVTEDADLGIRLFKKGYKTAMIDSMTLEEANSKFGNWLRQRSRWIKGYMQTYLVHIRQSASFVKSKGIHSLIFQLVIGGKIAFILINPLLWVATIAYFTLYSFVGSQIEALYPNIVFYMAVTSLVFGNFLFLYYYMIGVAKKGQWNLMKFVLLIPIYWLMISIAAFIALYQLIFKPHYWEKTVHGFHLNKRKEGSFAEAVIESEESTSGFVFPSRLREAWVQSMTNKKVYLGGFLLVLSSVVANFVNFVFNAYLGRVLEFRDFALIGLTGGLLSFASILFGAFITTANFRSGFLIGKYGDHAAYAFWKHTRKRAILISMVITAVWLILSPFLNQFFKTGNIYLFLLFGIVLFVGFANGMDRGFLSARLKFGSLAVVTIFDPLVKLLAAVLLVYLGLQTWTFSAVPLAVLGTFIVAWFLSSLSKKQIMESKPQASDLEIRKFPKKFFAASFFTNFSSIAFLTTDILLANYFLNNAEAGKYTLLSLVGKMVYFMGGLTSPFIMPLTSRSEGANKSSVKTLYLILFSTALLSFVGFTAFGLLGHITIPLLYGEKALTIVPYLIFFTFGITAYSISHVLVKYYLVKRVYTFTVATAFLVVVQILLINLYHSNFGQIAMVMAFVWGVHLLLTTAFHLGIRYVRIFENNFADLLGLFTTRAKKSEKFSILIFNWRDTRHKWAGGAEVYTHEIAKRWVKEGNSVTLFCGNSNKSPRNEVIDGVQICRRGGFYMVYVWAILYYIFRFRGKYDVIIDCENGIPFFTPLYARGKKFLLIHHVHQEVFRKSLIRPFSWFASFLEIKLMPLVYRDVQVITVSPSSKEEIMRHKLTQKEPIIIYNGVDLKKFKPGIKSKNPLILYLGRLQYYKSLNIFIKAAKKVLKEAPNAEFVIAGEGEEKKKLQKYAKRIGMLDKIRFLGHVSHKEKVRLFQKAWVFVNPSLMEGWGLTTIEAAACGTPTVASNVPGLRDSIDNPHTGILVKYGDPEAFTDGILKLIENEKFRKEMSHKSIKWANNFSWDKSAREFYKKISEIL